MPNITVKMYPGRSEEEKKVLAEKLAETLLEVTGVPEAAVSVVIKDIPPEEWKREMAENDFADRSLIYRMPGYPID